jgi:hypothetical protein
MNAKEKVTPDKYLQLAFDVGHSSIGWAVLKRDEVLGCGAVTFGADDCLASKRRAYRRQRRHTRSTRQRIARIEQLLAYLKIMEPEQLAAKHRQAGGNPAPWLLAARILASDRDCSKYLLNWPDLWDVIRWYAHNRGYDGNVRWANASDEHLSAAEQEEKKADTEKEKKAVELMRSHGRQTMAETVFADLFAPFNIGDPTRVDSLPFLQKRFKANQCAFPRKVVEAEVARLLDAHTGRLNGCNKQLIHLLLTSRLTGEDRRMLGEAGIRLPKRFEGGLLFGQLVPRFDNRIIAECPVTGEKVPGKHCLEFLEFRWAMNLSNIRIGFGTETYRDRDGVESKLRPLSAKERRKVDARMRRLGFLKVEPDKPGKDGLVRPGRNELRDILLQETTCDRHNLETLLLHPDAKDGLKLLPIKGDAAAFRVAWSSFGDPADVQGRYRDDRFRHRFTEQLLRRKRLTVRGIFDQLQRLGEIDVAARLHAAAEVHAKGKKTKIDPAELDELLDAQFWCDKLKGRSRYSRAKLAQAVQEVFHPTKPVHPLEKGGCLEQTEEIKQAALSKPVDQQTNNHLVRHRLLILRRLQEHLVDDYASGSKSRIDRITVEVARDLQTMSGMTNKEKAKEFGSKIKHHHEIAVGLAEQLKDEKDENGRPFIISPALIRKARIADDLDWECPYTGKIFEAADLVHRRFDKDHIVPRSKRLSDALEAIVITSQEVNAEKKNRTALQFIKEMNLPENLGRRERLGIRTEAQFRAFVDKLKTKGSHPDDVRRRKRRKELLLVEKYEEKEFTPADLSKTRFINKLAGQQLMAAFRDLPEKERPAVISVPGAVTSTFRDKSWKLLPLLGAANEKVNKLHAVKQQANADGRDFNLKAAIRHVTHLHHALDAVSVGLITNLLVPPGEAARAGLNGELARFIHKGKLTDEERREFEVLIRQLRLRGFYRFGVENRIGLKELDEELLNQIRRRLAEKRVVQHMPANMRGLKIEENTRGVMKIEHGRVHLRQRMRDEKTGKLNVKVSEEARGKIVGTEPLNQAGKLQAQKGARVIQDNFAVAVLDVGKGADKFMIVPWHKVWHQLQRLASVNGGKWPQVIRKGDVLELEEEGERMRYRIFGAGQRARGLYFDAAAVDELERSVELYPTTLLRGNFRLVKTTLSGQEMSLCPIT